MKRIYCFFVLGLCLLYACSGNRQVTEQLDRAEALLEAAHPDSAWALLDSLDTPDRWSDRPFARWCMLYCRAADKLYKDMLYTEQLTRALDWYKRHGSAEETAWMGLYLGRSYVEDKLFLPATNSYTEALALAEKEKLYNVAGYICSYMADLYAYTRQTTEERRKFEEAATYFQKAGNRRSYALALRDVAKTWAFEDSLSLALDLMLKADSIVTDSAGISSIANCLGNVYEAIGDIEKAKSFYLKSLTYDKTNQAPTYLALSALYYNQNIFDSAQFYLKRTSSPTLNPYTSTDRLYLGYLIEKEAGNIEKSLNYLEQYHEKKDSLYDAEKQVDIIDAEKRHDVVTLVEQNKDLHQYIYVSTLLAIIVIAAIGLFYQYKDRKRLTQINKQQRLLDEKEWKLKQLEKEAFEKGITDQIEMERIHKETISAKQEIIRLKYEKLSYSNFFKELREQSRTDKKEEHPLSRTNWIKLQNCIDSICPNWKEVVQRPNAVSLTEADIETCYLSFLDISLKSEARLLDISPDAANKRRFRARQNLGITNKGMRICDYIIDRTIQSIDS